MKTIELNQWGQVPINNDIISYGFYGCVAVLMQSNKFNALFHIVADNVSFIRFTEDFYNKHNIKKCIQFLPIKVENYELKSLDIESKIVRYEPNVYLIDDNASHIARMLGIKETISFKDMINIDVNRINRAKSDNWIGIINNKIKYKNLQINETIPPIN
jgi:hypothetical protein